jgi:thiol:disulfide interchange protein DsbA
LRWVLGCLVALLSGLACAQAAAPAAGRDYRVLEPARPTARGHIEILEFFYYGCHLCHEAQPHLARWLKSAGPDVVLRRMPAVANESWEPLARAYFALESLGEHERLHQALFDGQHVDGRQLDREENLLAWLAATGVDPTRFKAARSSLDTLRAVETVRRMGGMHGVRAVPTLVIGGRYVTSARMAGGVTQMLGVAAHLVERVRQERAAK